MSVIKKWLLVLIIILAIVSVALLAGACDGIGGDIFSNDTSGRPDPECETLIIGEWVVSQYQGIDGKVQSMDIYDPAKRITYIFDKKNIVVKWGNQGDQNGTYEWYINDATATGITSIVVHFNAVTSGSIKSDSGDVHFDIRFSEDDRYLILTVRETGEISTLKREK